MLTMLSWPMTFTAFASLKKRSTIRSSASKRGWSILIATFEPMAGCSPMKTEPIPPSPSSLTTRHEPTTRPIISSRLTSCRGAVSPRSSRSAGPPAVGFGMVAAGYAQRDPPRQGARDSTRTSPATSRLQSGGELDHRLLRVAEEHERLVSVVELVVDARETRGQAPLADHHHPRPFHFQDRHPVDRASPPPLRAGG